MKAPKRIFAFTSIAVFVLILLIGLLSQVSVTASLLRALVASLLFTALLWVVISVTTKYTIPDILEDINTEVINDTGSKIDFTVTETMEVPMPNVDNISPQNNPDFVPLSARQIDPNLNKVINNDPEKMAEIVRKMGFEEESA